MGNTVYTNKKVFKFEYSFLYFCLANLTTPQKRQRIKDGYSLYVISHTGEFNPDGSPGILSCRVHQLHFCRGYTSPNKYPEYDTKQSDGEAPVMLKLWGMQSTPSLSLLPGPL